MAVKKFPFKEGKDVTPIEWWFFYCILFFIFIIIQLVSVSASIPITLIDKGNHTKLDNLNWSVAGHIFDTNFDLNNHNITASYYCNSTNCYSINDFLSISNETSIILSINTTKNIMNLGFYNKSDVFNNTAFNQTQMSNSNGVLNILVSWLTSLFVQKSGDTMTGQLNAPSVNATNITASYINNVNIGNNPCNMANGTWCRNNTATYYMAGG